MGCGASPVRYHHQSPVRVDEARERDPHSMEVQLSICIPQPHADCYPPLLFFSSMTAQTTYSVGLPKIN